MTCRALIKWLVWFTAVGLLLHWFAHRAMAGPVPKRPVVPRPVAKTNHVSAAVSKGAGAAALLAGIKPAAVLPVHTNTVTLALSSLAPATTNISYTEWDTKTQKRVTNSTHWLLTFQMEAKDKLSATNWTVLGTTTNKAWTDRTTNNFRFYRVAENWQ